MTWGLRMTDSTINTFIVKQVKVVYLTGSFLIVHIEVRYFPLYGLLILYIP